MAPDVSIIILSWNTLSLLANCLRSIPQGIGTLDVEILVVDNGSSDGSQEMVRQQFPHVCLIENGQNLGFARANNQAMAASHGRYVLLLNSDTIVQPKAIEAMVACADADSTIGVVGAQLLNADGSFQASHTRFPTLWHEFLILSRLGRLWYGSWYPSHGPGQSQQPADADYVEGACLLARREAVTQVGGLDEGYFMYAEEVDWCFNMRRAGWRVAYVPQARIIHLSGGSSKSSTRREALLYRGRVRFFRKNHGSWRAAILKAMIYASTAIKLVWHRLRRGRAVVGWRELRAALQEA
ncbi:MAG TPA: glycosyltransferase family 2 protein [Anaerolineae bacterium]